MSIHIENKSHCSLKKLSLCFCRKGQAEPRWNLAPLFYNWMASVSGIKLTEHSRKKRKGHQLSMTYAQILSSLIPPVWACTNYLISLSFSTVL